MADHQRCDNLPTIQILIFIPDRIAQYYQKVKGKGYDLIEILDLEIDFRHCCPVCGGVDCALFLGYYTRVVVDENGTCFKEFPIARYQCRGKGKRMPQQDRTFSLLPYQLVPYTRYSLAFIIKSLRARYEEGLSIVKLQDYLAAFGRDEVLLISADQLSGFKQIILEAVNKIIATGHYRELEGAVFRKSTEKERLVAFMGLACCFECSKVAPSIRGPDGLGYDFYLNEGGFVHNAHFLFGTPHQFRK